MSMFDNIKDKVQGLVDEHGEQAGAGSTRPGTSSTRRPAVSTRSRSTAGSSAPRMRWTSLDGQDDDIS